MDILELLQEAKSKGLFITIHEEELRVSGPRAEVSLVEQIRERKAEVLHTLRGGKSPPELETAGLSPAPDEHPMYVCADDLTTVTDDHDWFANDVRIGGRVYRRLSPEYYAYLENKVSAQESKLMRPSGLVHPLCVLRLSLKPIRKYAVRRWGEDRLDEAARLFVPRRYTLPPRSNVLEATRVRGGRLEAWTDPENGLIAWLETHPLPGGFDLRPHERVVDGEQFRCALLEDLADGPGGPRAQQAIEDTQRIHQFYAEEERLHR